MNRLSESKSKKPLSGSPMMRRLLVLLTLAVALAPVALMAPGCGSDLTAKEKPQLSVNESAVRFDAAIVGSQANSKQVFVSNTSDSETLIVDRVTLVSDSPLLTLFVGSALTTEATNIELKPRANTQIDVFYNPTSSDIGCGPPPTSFPSGCPTPQFEDNYCGHLEVIASNSQDPTCVIVPVYVAQNSGVIQVSTTELLFDPSPAEDTRQQVKEFLVENVGSNSLSLKGITLTIANSDAFTIGGQSATTVIPPGGAANYSLTLQAKAVDVGASTGSLVIASDDPNNPTKTIRVQVGDPGGASITVDPRELTYVNVTKPDSANQEVTVTNTGAGAPVLFTVALRKPTGEIGSVEDFTVYDKDGQAKAGPSCENVGANDPCRAALQVNRGDSHILNVTYAPQGDQGSNAELVVRPQGLPEVVVSLSGTGGQASLTFDPSLMNLVGPAANGETVSDDVVFTNIGGADATITDVTKSSANPGSCDHYAVSPVPSTGSPVTVTSGGGTSTFTITFTRPDDGPFPIAHQCDLTFVHSGGEATVTASVSYP